MRPQPIDPAVGGGRLRLLGLYHALGDSIEARYVGSYDWPGEKYRRHHLSATLEEIDVPLSEAHHAAAARLAGDVGGKTVIDLAFPRQCHLSPAYLAEAREAIEWADIVVFSHPWVFPLVSSELRASQLVVYDSQNVEGFLQAQRLGDSNAVEVQLLREVVEAEYAVGRRADLILACSSEDLNLFVRVYEWPADKIRIIPNAVMASRIMPPSTADRAQARKEVGLAVDDVAAIFVGSAYQPNVEAADFIVHDLAHRLPNCHFVIAGGVGSTVDKTLAANITVTGPLDDLQKLKWLHACDLAVNPMFSGSGTNIKMFDFMAAGLPVVSTRVGARGISTAGRQPITIANDDADAFAGCVQMLIGDREELRRRGTDARACVDDDYSWEKISPQLGRLLTGWKHTLGQPRPRFTVILTTDRHDQLNSLMGCLQDQVERDFEVVLVDQSPRPWPGRNNNPGFPLNYVHMTVKGAVRAKNLGALHAQGAILAFVDHDCRPVPDWLRAAYPYFTAANVQALEWLAGSDSREPPSFMQCLEVKFEEARFINSNLMIRAEAFHNAGGFSFPSPRGRKDVRRLAHLSTVGQACGVGEYTARLLVALAATRVQNYLVTCSTKRVRPSVSALPVPGEIGWEYDDEAWRDSRIDATGAPRLAEWGADHVLIQYHPAFFSGPMLTGFAESCLALGMHVAVVIHNFSLADFSSFNRLCEMGCLLIAHSSREVAEARAKGIAVTHLPFFVPSYGPRALKSIAGRNLQEAPPVIASTGFIRPHKGLRQLIEALVIVRQVYPRAQLKLICALHPAPDSLEEYRMCIDTIEKHGLEGAVEFESGFLPIDEVHRRLAATDLAVLPYGPSTEGGSAAAATVIAAGVPLLISRSEVFESVLSAADVLPDTEPHTIAGHICRVLGDAAAYDDLAARSVRHGEANSVSAVGRRLLQVLATQAREPGSSTP